MLLTAFTTHKTTHAKQVTLKLVHATVVTAPPTPAATHLKPKTNLNLWARRAGKPHAVFLFYIKVIKHRFIHSFGCAKVVKPYFLTAKFLNWGWCYGISQFT